MFFSLHLFPQHKISFQLQRRKQKKKKKKKKNKKKKKKKKKKNKKTKTKTKKWRRSAKHVLLASARILQLFEVSCF